MNCHRRQCLVIQRSSRGFHDLIESRFRIAKGKIADSFTEMSDAGKEARRKRGACQEFWVHGYMAPEELSFE